MNRTKRASIVCVLLLALSVVTRAGDYEKAWEALHHNDRQHAYEFFRKSLKSDPAHKSNAMAALMMLEIYDAKTDFLDHNPNPLDIFTDVNPYVYAMWFTDGILGSYGKKSGRQADNLERILHDNRFNGSLHAAANYFKGYASFQARQVATSDSAFTGMGSLEEWQYAGAFDNISGSGFNKEYGPIKEPHSGKGFVSYKNTAIDWFTPLSHANEGWMMLGSVFLPSAGVGYAQTFVNSPVEQDALLCTGGGGTLKVWLNDKLMVSEEEELGTELDQYNVKCHLKKGYNRVLVQVGFTPATETPNFIVRLTDDKMNALSNLTSTSQVQSYTTDNSTDQPVLLPHFAEVYFKEKMAKNPQDPMYAFLLSQVYLRNEEHDKAKAAMYELYKKYPDDPLIIYQYLTCLSTKYDQTTRLELVEKIKTIDPNSTQVLQNNEGQLEKEKKYTEAMDLVQQMEKNNGVTLWTMAKKLYLYGAMEKVDSALDILKAAYAKYPDNSMLVKTMYAYYTQMMKSPLDGMHLLEKYTARQLDVDEMETLAQAYFDQNEQEKGVDMLRQIVAVASADARQYGPLVRHFYDKQEYDSAIYYMQIQHQLNPYNYQPLGDMASAYLQKGDKDKALDYFRQALAQNPGSENYRKQIREIEKKQDVFSYFPALDVYAEINKALKEGKDTSKSYYYIFDDRKVVLYAEGASESLASTAVFINNKDGVESWKQLNLPYNSVYQDMTIIKAEVIKKNGSKVPAETYEDEIVYTNLEPGDVVYYTYKTSSYGIGRLGREFWDKFHFSTFAPAKLSRYSIMVADKLPLYYEMSNGNGLKPAESRHEDFRMYTWEMKNLPALKDEVFRPDLDDIGDVLHVSTVKSWDVIAEWYSDITRIQSKADFEIDRAFREIFPDNSLNGLSDHEKARHIYNYIEANVSYSSVSFRQGAYVPQRASKTLSTKLGDCKDLSALFLSFARKAGIDANLVLVSTRDNGQKSMQLPSMEFNHCIVRFKDGADYRYVELTNNFLSFDAMPQTLIGAQVLNIPYTYNTTEKVQLLDPAGDYASKRIRKVKVKVDNADLQITTDFTGTGELASAFRSEYAGKAADEIKDSRQKDISRLYRNTVVLDQPRLSDLEKLVDSVTVTDNYIVKNEVISVGDFSMLRVPLHEVVVSLDIFTNEARQYPFEYWQYENTGLYNTEVEIELPAGKNFDQVPSNQELSFKDMKYSITYERPAPGKLVVKRVFHTNTRDNIAPADFAKMKDFFTAIVTAEQKYISFK